MPTDRKRTENIFPSYLHSTKKAFDNINLLKERGTKFVVKQKMWAIPISPKKKYMVV